MLPASVWPELLRGLKLWSPSGKKLTLTCDERTKSSNSSANTSTTPSSPSAGMTKTNNTPPPPPTATTDTEKTFVGATHEYVPAVVQEQKVVDTTLSQNLPIATNQPVTIEYKYITVIYDGKRMYLDYSVPKGMIVNPVKKIKGVDMSAQDKIIKPSHLITMDDIIREGNPTLRAVAKEVTEEAINEFETQIIDGWRLKEAWAENIKTDINLNKDEKEIYPLFDCHFCTI